MSPTFQELPPPTETSRLQARVARLRASMEWASEAIDPAVRDEVNATIARCSERLALGVDTTIVALAGGTGSGKSSLFNAITGTSFAVPGVARPTTSDVAAASWGPEAALLDWLGVDPARRVVLEPYGSLRGVVLLDLPDHDSVNVTNRATVDRLVPLADLIVWVVDPQKYADHALHSAYLTVASDHGQPCVVVLNHIDRLTPDEAHEVATDLARLIAVEGVAHAPVLQASARTGIGIEGLRLALGAAAATRSVAAEAVRADLVAAGRALEGALARVAEPVLPDVDGLVAAIARAAGVEAMADAAGAAAAGKEAPVVPSPTASIAAVDQVRLEWIDAATAGLPLAWRIVLDDAVVATPALTEAINTSLAATQWPTPGAPSGLGTLVPKAARGKAAAAAVRTAGRRAVRDAVYAHVVAPTEMIHEAYRNLDELTELD